MEGEVATGMEETAIRLWWPAIGGAIRRRFCWLRLAWALSMHHELVMPVVPVLRWTSNKG